MFESDAGESEVAKVTPEHPFGSVEHGWVAAGDLAVGDLVLTASGGWMQVAAGTWLQETATVYNLEVQGFHTYFVGEAALWVHNQCDECGGDGGKGGSGAANAANAYRLASQLARQEAASVFKNGGLHPDVIAGARPIIPGSALGNKGLIRRLTADGSRIGDWAKMSTQSFKSPSGQFQVHFYKNSKTGAVHYGDDFKAVFNHGGDWP